MPLKEKYTVTHTSPRNEGYATCREAEGAKGRPGQRLYWGSHQDGSWGRVSSLGLAGLSNSSSLGHRGCPEVSGPG